MGLVCGLKLGDWIDMEDVMMLSLGCVVLMCLRKDLSVGC
jgi:hypothetical protein